MLAGPTTTPDEANLDTLAHRLARSLSRRYLLVLTLVAVLIVVDEGVIEPSLVRVAGFAPVINTAGRQRMLSQRLTKSALAIRRPGVHTAEREACRAELRLAVAEWSAAHTALQVGNHESGIAPTRDPQIVAAFRAIQGDFATIRAAAIELLELPEADQSRHTQLLQMILAHEPRYLRQMDVIVSMYEADARQTITRLRFTSLAGKLGILGLMVTLGCVVLRPATGMIRQQVTELEVRVQERTEQLATAHRDLAAEMHDREQAELRTRQLLEQLSHVSRVTTIGELATGLAHELNQPLAAITNYAECCDLLIKDHTPHAESFRNSLGRIKQTALRASQIIRRLHRLVQKQPADRIPTDFLSLLHDVRDLCVHELQRHQIEIEIDFSAGFPAIIADPIRLQQVLVNLVQNAVQAIRDAHSLCRTIRIDARAAENQLLVNVSDTGPGLGSQDPENIFLPFLSTKTYGLGMGLAISRSIIQEHGGRMWAGCTPGGGARISFSLPYDSGPQTFTDDWSWTSVSQGSGLALREATHS